MIKAKQHKYTASKGVTYAMSLCGAGFILLGLPSAVSAAIPPLVNEDIFAGSYGVFTQIDRRGSVLYMTCEDLYCTRSFGSDGASNNYSPEGEVKAHEKLGLAHQDLGLAEASKAGDDGERGILPDSESAANKNETDEIDK